jgi:tetratricopeptide (TPR) repeat protein
MTKAILTTLVLALGLSPAAAQPNQVAADLEAKGDVLRGQGDYSEAEKCYTHALSLGGHQAALYNKIGQAYLRMHLYTAAQSAFEQAVKRNPSDAYTLNNLGVANHLQKRYDRAVKWYKKALALNESEPAFHYNLGGSWFALGKFDRASAEFARALELDPNAFTNMEEEAIIGPATAGDRGKFSYMMAKLFASRGDLDRALAALRKAKEQGYEGLNAVYSDREFGGLWKDARLAQLIPPARR